MTAGFHAPDGRRLAFRDGGGAGPALLCLAGLTRNGRDFDGLAGHLAGRWRVIRLDSRGRGESEAAADPLAEYTLPVETGDALALIAHLGLSRLAILGTSRGGLIGMAIAAARPELVAGLVLNDVGAVVARAGLERIAAGLGAEPPADFAAAAAALAARHAADFPGVPPARWEAHARAIHREEGGRPRPGHDPRLAEAVRAAMDSSEGDITLWPLLETLAATPMLVIRGENSDILTRETLKDMANRHPRLEAVEIRDRGHAPFLDEPEALAAIDRFLGGIAA